MSDIISVINVTIAAMHKNPIVATLLTLAGIALVTVIIYNLPPVHERFAWRVDLITTYIRMSINPVGAMPTPIAQNTDPASASPTLSPTPVMPLRYGGDIPQFGNLFFADEVTPERDRGEYRHDEYGKPGHDQKFGLYGESLHLAVLDSM